MHSYCFLLPPFISTELAFMFKWNTNSICFSRSVQNWYGVSKSITYLLCVCVRKFFFPEPGTKFQSALISPEQHFFSQLSLTVSNAFLFSFLCRLTYRQTIQLLSLYGTAFVHSSMPHKLINIEPNECSSGNIDVSDDDDGNSRWRERGKKTVENGLKLVEKGFDSVVIHTPLFILNFEIIQLIIGSMCI